MPRVNELFSFDVWTLTNLTTQEVIQGQYSTKVTSSLGNKYNQISSLSRQDPIIQFVNGEAETLSFPGMFRSRDISWAALTKSRIDKLRAWTKIDTILGHPPILGFSIGDQILTMDQCILEGLSDIVYDEPTLAGVLRQVSFNINLTQYTPFEFEQESGETRYHKTKLNQYYEMLCLHEYNNPLMGDIIRHRHPSTPVIHSGTVVKLPSVQTIQKETIEPKSPILYSAFGIRDTPQRALRLEMLDKRNESYVSHVVRE
jgi:hypothetical protein